MGGAKAKEVKPPREFRITITPPQTGKPIPCLFLDHGRDVVNELYRCNNCGRKVWGRECHKMDCIVDSEKKIARFRLCDPCFTKEIEKRAADERSQ
jgi:hypothetical protein